MFDVIEFSDSPIKYGLVFVFTIIIVKTFSRCIFCHFVFILCAIGIMMRSFIRLQKRTASV
jgi:hypothetical protein